MSQPSLLDYLLAKLRFWRAPPEGLPSLRRLWSDDRSTEPAATVAATPAAPSTQRAWRLERGSGPPPLATVSALLLALAAPFMFAVERPAVAAGVVLLAGAAGAAVFAVRRGEVALPAVARFDPDPAPDPRPRPALVIAAAAAASLTWVTAAGNRADWLLAAVWVACLALALAAITAPGRCTRWRRRVADAAGLDRFPIGVPRSALLPLLLMAVAVVVRTRELASVPAEMVSVHAEALLAVVRAAGPDAPVIFPWSPGGLEPIPVFLGALLAPLAGGPSFASLKLGTVLAGLATLPLIYLLGREVGGRGAGVAALALAAVGSWPDLVSRIGLAEGWLPLFAAAVLLLLLRAIRRTRRLDFAAAGVAVGLAVQTTSLARSLVLTSMALIGVAAIAAPPERRRRLLAGLGVVLIFAGLGALPTLAAGVDASRQVAPGWWFGGADGAVGQPVAPGLAERLARSLALPLWSDGTNWDHGGGERPALDRVAAALLVLGTAFTAIAAIARRRLESGLLLLALPLLMLPAALATLEPALAPSPLRCAGAIAPVFVVAGVGLAAVMSAVATSLADPAGRRVAATVAVLLVALSAAAGRGVVLGGFAETWRRSAWNASELGAVVRAGLDLGVPADRARVVPYPHWVDTRLVAVEAGFPGADLALDPRSVDDAAGRAGPQLYLVHPDDRGTLRLLRTRLPAAAFVDRPSRVEGKRFVVVINLARAGED